MGDTRINWHAQTNQHPVISQAMYRLKAGRIEQIGTSWIKHGFFATSGTVCSGLAGCDGDFTGMHLGVGCSDTYSANLNGQQSNMSPRSILNVHSGDFAFP